VAAPLQQAATAASLRDLEFLCPRIPIRQTDRQTDITTGLHIAFFAFTGNGRKKNQ